MLAIEGNLMMRFGACGAFESAELLLDAGFDIVELPVFSLFETETFGDNASLSGKLETYNCFVPGSMKVVGPSVDWPAVKEYVATVLDRIVLLGGKLVVFGSGGARRIPEGYSRDEARRDTLAFLTIAGDGASSRGLTVAIEPLNSGECNWINSVEEAYELAVELNHPAVGVLSDLYHVSLENESYEGMRKAGRSLMHVHVASPITREAVSKADLPVLCAYFKVLKEMGYDGRIVLECNWKDIGSEAAAAHATLVEAWAAA
jgi:D-psicose/D-tagatose/L-ribulose 3-epimerase